MDRSAFSRRRGRCAHVLALVGALALLACSGPAKRVGDEPDPGGQSPAGTPATATTAGTLGTSSAAPGADDAGPADRSEAVKTMQPSTPTKFKRGAPLAPAAELVTYLETLKKIDGSRLRVRLPVALTMDPTGFGISSAKVGDLDLDLDDGALGISLADRARNACEGTGRCAFWLEGHFTAPASFAVRKVGEAIEAAALAEATHCDVEDL